MNENEHSRLEAAVDRELDLGRCGLVLIHDRRLQLLAVGPAKDAGEQALDDRTRLGRENVAGLRRHPGLPHQFFHGALVLVDLLRRGFLGQLRQ